MLNFQTNKIDPQKQKQTNTNESKHITKNIIKYKQFNLFSKWWSFRPIEKFSQWNRHNEKHSIDIFGNGRHQQKIRRNRKDEHISRKRKITIENAD